MLKFMFSKKATKNYKIFTVDLTLFNFIIFCGLLRKHELYHLLVDYSEAISFYN